ncbi:MAG: hypothetical protein OEW68_02440 [Gammaproteobacteria bacterium]|nr:hypothetical protein [Gammaproteobacteria bacterium]MDH4313686.1 hypothetical protein [Gammaproteobacteria bacterium]MDH5214597.1 hypothetical protein [Gammaproteobacteria bacterium]MDH5500752.1 hypothetical protein [Gammaproteobacteria bacterium]
MKKSNHPGVEDTAQKAIDALTGVDCKSVSFVQLRKLNAALLDASERVAAETAHRSNDDALGDTVRVAVPTSTDR